MGNTSKQNMLWLCQCLLCLLLTLASATHGQGENPNTATIAIAGPMSGTSVSVGTQFQAGVRAAIALETDGTLLGKKLIVTEFDDRCRANIALSVAEEIVRQEPKLVIGHSCSASTLATAPVYAAQEVLQITPASTAPNITELGLKTIFRMLGRDDQQGQLAAQHILEHFPEARIGILRFPTSYSIGATEEAMQVLERAGAEIAQMTQAVASATSYLEQVLLMMEANVDVVYVVGGVLDIGVFTRQASMLRADFRIISADSLISATFPSITGPEADDVMFTFPAEIDNQVSPERFSEIAQAIYQHRNVEARGYALLSFAAVQVWIEGVNRAGSFAAAEVAAAIRESTIETIIGDVSFDEKGDITTDYPNFTWHIWRDGESHVME